MIFCMLLQTRLAQLQTEFQCGEALEVAVSAVLVLWNLFSFLWVIEHTCFFLGMHPWMWPRHGHGAHPGLLAAGFSWWWAHDPRWSEQNWCWDFPWNKRKKASLPSGPGMMLMLAWRNEAHHEHLPRWKGSNRGWQSQEMERGCFLTALFEQVNSACYLSSDWVKNHLS